MTVGELMEELSGLKPDTEIKMSVWAGDDKYEDRERRAVEITGVGLNRDTGCAEIEE